jgi:hypothetical protein
VKPKDALIKDGFPVKAGKGRLSRDAIERVKELAASGWNIDGYSITHTAESKVVKEKTGNDKNIADLFMPYPKNLFKAVLPNGDIVGMPSICVNCRVSLSGCGCGAPRVRVGMDGTLPVKIVSL